MFLLISVLCLVLMAEPKETDPKDKKVEEKKEPHPVQKVSAAEYRRLYP